MARFSLRRPLFRRSKTTTSSSTADSSTIGASADPPPVPLLNDVAARVRKSTTSLRDQFLFGTSSTTTTTAAASPPLFDHVASVSPPSTAERPSPTRKITSSSSRATQRASIASLGSVSEDKEEAHDLLQREPQPFMNQVRPAFVVQEPTPPTSENHISVQSTAHSRSPLSSAPLLEGSKPPPPPPPQQQQQQQQQEEDSQLQQQYPQRPGSSGALSLQAGSVTRHSSSASPKHTSRTHSLVDSANADTQAVTDPAIARKSTMPRKIWVRRPGASATLVQVREDDLVDDVREMILRKYANSLGRTFDAPDMTLRIFTRGDGLHTKSDRVLGPEEDICRTIDMMYPDGQTVEDALLIDVPTRRTPKPSPRPHYGGYHALDDYRPVESGTDYFPPMATMQPVLPSTLLAQENPRSMAVLTTGQLPPIPSPGSTRKYHHRPKFGRQHTSSPTIVQHNPNGIPLNVATQLHASHRMSTRPRVDSSASDTHQLNHAGVPPPPPAIPTPPAPEAAPTGKGHNGSSPPTPSNTSASLNPNRAPRPRKPRKTTPEKSLSRRRERRGSGDSHAALGLPSISSMLDGSVPPINVLIVEDNSINLRVLEGLMKRLRVRWDSATNGQIAVDKWRKGGYHLILMDIQMPVMNGLQATKEIRRLEKVNGIGVFSGSTPSSPEERRRANTVTDGGEEEEDADNTNARDRDPAKQEQRDPSLDRLTVSEGIFKSPIIIVALTASSLQSDRHQALAAGCNDFLTKPVNMGWLERKVKEWGCMQALIDFEGWKRWRDINEKEEAGKTEEQKKVEREKEEKQKLKMEKFVMLQEKRKAEEESRKKQQAATSAAAAATTAATQGNTPESTGAVPASHVQSA